MPLTTKPWAMNFKSPLLLSFFLLQEVTRAHKGWALDSVVLANNVTRYMNEDIRHPPAEGVYVYGLFLEGAGWDRKRGRLVEAKPKILYEPMPVLHIYAINSTASKDPKLYECPLYKKTKRGTDNYIGSLDLRTSVSPYHWAFRGVALLCDIK